jgi:hypothetical protein
MLILSPRAKMGSAMREMNVGLEPDRSTEENGASEEQLSFEFAAS